MPDYIQSEKFRMREFILLAAAALSLAPATANAGWKTGNNLYESCKSERPLQYADCTSFSMGIIDASELLGKTLHIPADITAGQLHDIVFKYLENHPENRHWPASILVWNAIREAYPAENPPLKGQ